MWKAVCTDIDGTLLNVDRRLSERTISAFQRIKDKATIILASSRMPAAMRHLQQDIGITEAPLICYNGGYIIDQTAGVRCLSSVTIPFAWVKEITSWCIANDLHASLYHEDEWYVPSDDFWAQRESNNTQVVPKVLANLAVLNMWEPNKIGAHKIMLMGEEGKIDKIVSLLTNMDAPLHLYRSKDTYLEIAPKAISKATALSLLIAERYDFSLPAIMAFGDNYNDIDMLRAVGKGIAVANAKPEVLAAAHEHTDHAKQDGVAKSIEKYFKF
jgi:Cof subfamily protein (haloacid dehalogenase superfamily)